MNKNAKNESALYHAAVQGNLADLNILLNLYSVKSDTPALLTAFHFALENEQVVIAQRLLEEKNLYNYVSRKRESVEKYETFFNEHMKTRVINMLPTP